MSQRDAHILRTLISIQDSVPAADANLRRALTEILAQALPSVPSGAKAAESVGLNDRVTVRSMTSPIDDEATFQLVLPTQSNAIEGKISVLAPMSLGVLGRRSGDIVTVETPNGSQRLKIGEGFLHKRASVLECDSPLSLSDREACTSPKGWQQASQRRRVSLL
eukprot:gene49024-60013_t